ncbi:TetR/AcrR family transcriptional regulator [Frankia sp. CNm7]|uniref:TetR/AcrR family transcriptional regulator n=1 Tax=Frankia nepalensis TaxID=1836974 RepID=A0A937RFQ5_9ACTN|nr:TetR/AcrR family transcriptional regulator [Frankia nepalensis]MBL7495797.1 TetR/AcrR family transcriptional regulator [Frankia nepalensis]MBL7513269.1 TetR/AcrR family transcriptional regulator [Frankia nepalensis]MBL7523779.1 TetR/AcrR family transcriptional regulator [Frankia nepalensis]MBL7628150.1 TetR/AcrR family transcriptional regulator [Frankia nepalensis]
MTSSRQPRRRYDASGRQAQARENRAKVIAAATRLFVEQGYTPTSIAQVAAAAGVSAPTVFAHFTSKANLLKIAVDVAIAGDDEEVPLHQRPAMRRVHDGATAEEVLERFAAAGADVAARANPLFEVVHAAADADPEIAALAAELDRQRLAGTSIIAASVADRLGVGGDPVAVERIRDTIWTMFSPQVYGLLVVRRGWPPEAYRAWVVRAAAAAVADA